MTPILLLAINEVHWRLFERYLSRPGFAHLNRFFGQSSHFRALAVERGEPSPWATWPTLYRGMNNERHGVRNLGQDPATFRGKPIWQEVRERGGSIGICGSMQSRPGGDQCECSSSVTRLRGNVWASTLDLDHLRNASTSAAVNWGICR